MSFLPSPLKSPVPTIFHTLGGAFPTPADWVTCEPFINQIATSPLAVFCQRMSPMPSPLKSPVPTTDQAPGTFPTPADCATCAPLRNHIATLPLVSRHS